MILNLDVHREKVRRLIVNLVFIIYWLLIFEGTLRKWAFPQYHRYLFFIRDPFVLLVYWLAFSNRLLPKKKPMFSFGISLTVLFLLFTLLQAITTTVGISTLIYGWRMYFFYFPLAFIIGENFRGEDLKRLLRQTLLVAIPVAVLVYKQHSSPPSAFINISAESGGVIFTIAGERGGSIVRPTGTFTFFHGQQLFIGSLIAFLFTAWILPKRERPLSNKILVLTSGAALVNLALSGTRLPYILAALICLAAAFSSFVIRRQRISVRAMVFPIILLFIGILCFVWFFSAIYEVTLERHRSAEITGNPVLSRIGGMLYNFVDFVSRAPLLGSGIGSHTSGGSVLTTGERRFAGAIIDDEWSRIVTETGPIFGFLYITLRILLVGWLFMGAIRATSLSNNPSPLLLFAFIGSIVLVWNTTDYGTEMGYAWLFTGFCIAANQLGQKVSEGGKGVWS